MSTPASAPATKKAYIPLFRNMTQTICAKKLKRNELLVAIYLLEKTLGFGKPKDQLTTGIIAYQTGIRKDRVKSAIQGVLDSGLFERKTSPRFEYEYQIGQQFLDQHKGHFFAPALPKNGKSFRKTEKFSENREHTALYLHNSLPSPIQQQSQVDLSGWEFHLDNSKSFTARCGCRCGQIEYQTKTSEPMPSTSPSLNKAESVNIQPIHPKSSASAKTQTKTNSQFSWTDTVLELPKSILPNQQQFVLNILKKGTVPQAKEALQVFAEMDKKGLVRNPPFLLKSLAEAAQTDSIIIFDQDTPLPKTKATIPPVPNALDDGLTRYAEKYGFSAPRQAADFTYFYYRNLLRQERNQRLEAEKI